MRPPHPRRATAGFTLLELLVVMAVLGILVGIAGFGLQNSIKNARNADFVQALAQDINLARSVAMAKGQRTQLQFVSASSYTVTNLDASGQPVLASGSNNAITMSGITVGDKLICSSNGFCLGYTSAGIQKTINQVTCTADGKTRTLSITVLGLTRLES